MGEPIPRRAVVTDAAQLLAATIDLLSSTAVEVDVVEEGTPPSAAADRAADAPVVIIGVMPFGEAEIRALRSTRLIIRAGIGYDMVDIDAATRAGVLVANVPDFCVDEVADHTLALLLAAMRRLPQALGTWRKRQDWHVTATLPPMQRLRGKRLGIVGMGRIGRQVAARAVGFGLEVVGSDPMLEGSATPEGVPLMDFGDLLASCDIVSLHCPLTEDNRHLLDDETLAMAKPGIVVINTSRGGLIDLRALDRALGSGQVSMAALDVLDGEPRPDLTDPLLQSDNVVVTSHVAWYSEDAKRELAIRTAEEALRFLDGDAVRNPVNPEVNHAASQPR